MSGKDKAASGKRPIFPLVTQILTMSLGLIAFIMSAVAASGCAFIIPESGTNEDGNFRCYDQYGLFKFNPEVQCTDAGVLYAGCTKYSNIFLKGTSGSIKPAQAMGAIAASFGGIIWAGCLFQLFFKFPRWLFKTVGGLYIFCFLTQMLTLLMLNHDKCYGEDADKEKLSYPDYGCRLGKDAITAIIAGIFYLGMGITVLICPVPKTAVITCCGDCCKGGCGDEDECGCCAEAGTTGAVIDTSGEKKKSEMYNSTVTETYNADGTITIREEKMNPDGSKTIKETIKPNPAAATASV